MVYVPEAPFYVGDNGTAIGSLVQGSSDTDPWRITSETSLSTENTAGNGSGSGQTAPLYYNPSITDGDSAGATYTVPAVFPKGFAPYYVMKSHITQQQWVSFFNTLTSAQKSTRDITATKGDSLAYRNNVSWTSGDATLPDQGSGATNAYVGMSYLSWGDVTAFLDWAGLRPLSELEYEKLGRGPLSSVSGEYAWGSASATQATSISNAGTGTERAQNGADILCCNDVGIQGPLRVGSFSYGVSTRAASGAGYYGAMDLSGSLWDRVVTLANASGRSFNGSRHGDGVLDATGDANVTSWPPSNAQGAGYRGGSWYDAATSARLSDRTKGAFISTTRDNTSSGRGARAAFGESIPASTPTATPTATETPTVTPTSTDTPTATPTATDTPTVTPTSTNTPTATPTNTPTNTPTVTPTATVTTTPTVTPTGTPACSELDSSWTPQWAYLQNYYKLNEASWTANASGQVLDSKGTSHGTARGNATTSSTAQLGRAGTLDGNGDWVDLPNTVGNYTNNFTIALWLRTAQSNQGRLLAKRTSSVMYDVYLAGSNQVNVYAPGGNFTSPTSLQLNTWYHVALVFNGSNSKVYINGIPNTTTWNPNISNTTSDLFQIGTFNSGCCGSLNGQIDDVAIWSTALTAAEVTTIYNQQRCGAP